MTLYHHVATMGLGISNSSQHKKFYRKNVPTLGLDFKFNNNRQNLQVCVRYKLMRVSSDENLKSIVLDRERLTGMSVSKINVSHYIQTPYDVTMKKDMEFLIGNAQYCVSKDYEEGDTHITCTVVESVD